MGGIPSVARDSVKHDSVKHETAAAQATGGRSRATAAQQTLVGRCSRTNIIGETVFRASTAVRISRFAAC